jgi:hypothetical protein
VSRQYHNKNYSDTDTVKEWDFNRSSFLFEAITCLCPCFNGLI